MSILKNLVNPVRNFVMTTQLNQGHSDGLDLAQLMDQIREDAENRKRNSFNNGAPSSYRQLITENFDALLSPQKTALPPLKLQPDLEKREQYQLNDLLGFHDIVFLQNAYKVILKRDPDDVGLAHFLKNLRNGRYSKIDVLSSLRFSPEGQRANVQIEGLGRLRVLRKIYRVPVAGYFLRLVVTLARLPVLITNFRRVESHTMAQLDRVAGHVNEAVAHLSDEIRKQARTNRTQSEALQKQLIDLKSTLGLQINLVIREHEKIVQSNNAFKQTQSTEQADLSSRLSETNQQQAEVHAELQALKVQVEKQIDELIDRLQKSRMDIAQQETRLSRLLDRTDMP